MSIIKEVSAQVTGAGVNTAEWLQLMEAIVNDEDSGIRDAGMLTLQALQEGNTIVVIEHNLDVIKTADWIVDLGPEGGSGGGEILVSGTPETVAECEASHTARFLKPLL